MNPITLSLTLQILEMLLAATVQAPAVVDAVARVKALLTSGVDPSPDLEAEIRAALDEANAALQAG
jgi:hypothetical protein